MDRGLLGRLWMAARLPELLGSGRGYLRRNDARNARGAQLARPRADGQPFFDKPPLFYILQMASFAALGATEFAAPDRSAISALALLWSSAGLGDSCSTVTSDVTAR